MTLFASAHSSLEVEREILHTLGLYRKVEDARSELLPTEKLYSVTIEVEELEQERT